MPETQQVKACAKTLENSVCKHWILDLVTGENHLCRLAESHSGQCACACGVRFWHG